MTDAERIAQLEAQVAQMAAALLTEDRIERHKIKAADCPPASEVVLVSSIRRLQARAPASPSPVLRDADTAPAPAISGGDTLEWAVSRWQAEVSNRPMVNVHRRTLDTTWRQVIRFAGGDPDTLVGPDHDAALAADTAPAPADCNNVLRSQNKAYPRTCRSCGLGPCKFGPTYKAPAPAIRHCPKCSSQRPGETCWKCGTETRVPHESWDYPRMPDVARIRALAKEVGYAIGEHGSKERDLDLIAAPWVDEAVDHLTLACHIAQGINARIVDGGPKPLGRHGFNLQIDGWFKLIDLSVCPRQSAPTPTISGGEMVSVPRVATEAMIEAGWIDKEDVDPQDIWAAMVEAAPAADRSA